MMLEGSKFGRHGAVTVALCLGAWTSPLLAATIPVSSQLQLTATAQATGGTTAIAYDADSQGAATGPLGVAVSALSTVPGTPASIVASGAATATFASAAQGTVTFRDLGWTVTAGTALRADLRTEDPNAPGFLPDWSYAFTVNTPSVFSLAWSVIQSGSNTFGLNNFFLNGSLQFAGLPVGNGALTRPLAAGAHTFTLSNFANISGSIGPRDARTSGVFDWRIDPVGGPVPEPGSLALLGLGVLASLGFRRRVGHRH